MALRYLSLLLVLLAAFALTLSAADSTAPRIAQISPDLESTQKLTLSAADPTAPRSAQITPRTTSRRALADSPKPKRVFKAYPDMSTTGKVKNQAAKMKDKAAKMASDAVLDAIKVMKGPIKAAKDPERQKALVEKAAKKAAIGLAKALFPGHAGAITAAVYVNQYVVPLMEAEIKKRLIKVKTE